MNWTFIFAIQIYFVNFFFLKENKTCPWLLLTVKDVSNALSGQRMMQIPYNVIIVRYCNLAGLLIS